MRKKGDGFLLFLKAFSWETDLLVTLGDFTGKKTQNQKGKSVFITPISIPASWKKLR